MLTNEGFQLRSQWSLPLNFAHDAGVKWACKMLPAAAVLSLPADSIGAGVLAETVAPEHKIFQNCGNSILSLTPKNLCSASRSEIMLPCLPWLVTCAKNLRLLDAHLGFKPWLPGSPLKHIKHLTLVLRDGVGNAFRVLPEATALETLSISSRKPPWQDDTMNAPMVFDVLTCLVKVALREIWPWTETCSLPKDCKLTYHAKDLDDLKFQARLWHGNDASLHGISVKVRVSAMAACIRDLRHFLRW